MTAQQTATYKAQVKTATLARELAKHPFMVSTLHDAMEQKPPFCLRILKRYRNTHAQWFRDLVAGAMRIQRRQERGGV